MIFSDFFSEIVFLSALTFIMAVLYRDVYGDPVYETHFVVPINRNIPDQPLRAPTHHTHFSVGPRKEGAVRNIAHKTHPIQYCCEQRAFSRGTLFYPGLQPQSPNPATFGLPVEEIHDWTEEEVELFSGALCPETEAQYNHAMAFCEEMESVVRAIEEEYAARTRAAAQPLPPSRPLWSDLAEEGQDATSQDTSAEEEDFPLDFVDEEKCPVCLEDEYTEKTYLLRLPCNHTLCKGCLNGVDGKCPKCRTKIDKSLIKRRK